MKIAQAGVADGCHPGGAIVRCQHIPPRTLQGRPTDRCTRREESPLSNTNGTDEQPGLAADRLLDLPSSFLPYETISFPVTRRRARANTARWVAPSPPPTRERPWTEYDTHN